MEKNKGNVNLGKQFVEGRKNELEWKEMRGMMHHLMNNISNQFGCFFINTLWSINDEESILLPKCKLMLNKNRLLWG